MLFAAESAKGSVTAILGFRTSENAILLDEFADVCETVIVTTDDGSLGIHGTVAGPLEGLLIKSEHSAVIACGPRPMLSAVAEICKRHGVPCLVSLEERMGCGVGACVVCACATKAADGALQMSRVCKDGPVFNASDVVW